MRQQVGRNSNRITTLPFQFSMERVFIGLTRTQAHTHTHTEAEAALLQLAAENAGGFINSESFDDVNRATRRACVYVYVCVCVYVCLFMRVCAASLWSEDVAIPNNVKTSLTHTPRQQPAAPL